jgi:hypothetical protein
VDARGGADAFPTIYVDSKKQTWLAWRENHTDAGILQNLNTGQRVDLGRVHGTVPFAFGSDCIAWLSSEVFDVTVAHLSAPAKEFWTPQGRAAGTGLSHLAGVPIRLFTIDEVRFSERGMVNPQRSLDVVVGEADRPGVGPCNVARLAFDTREAILWPGKTSNTPRVAATPERAYVVTWGAPWGVRLGIVELSDFKAPVTAPPPPVVVPQPPAPKPEPPKEPTVQIPDHFDTLQAVSDAHPHLLAANSRESMTELLWRAAVALHARDANWGLLSKSAGENHTVIAGQRVAVDALAYGNSDEIVDIFRAAYDGPGQGGLTWGIDERRPSNTRVTPPTFPGAPVPEPKPEPKPEPPPVVIPAPPAVDLGPVIAAIRELDAQLTALRADNKDLAEQNRALRARIEELAKHADDVAKQQLADFTAVARTIRPRLF